MQHISEVNQALEAIIDTHIFNRDLNKLLHRFISYKQMETSIWSKFPIYTHYMMGGSSPRIYYAAAQTELLILSLDIMDDLQDQDNFQPPWMDCEHHVAMNAASALLVAAIAGDLHSILTPAVLKLISTAHNGQHNDIRNAVATEIEYLQLINEKSSALISLAMQTGYQLIDSPDEAVMKSLHELAGYIGVAAQLENDIKDIARLDKRNDIIQRKSTLATLYLLEHSEHRLPQLQAYYIGSIGLNELSAYKEEIIQFIEESGVKQYVNAIQSQTITHASELLDRLPASNPWREKFKELAISPFQKVE